MGSDPNKPTLEEQIIEIANLALLHHGMSTSDVSDATRAAQQVCRRWQEWLRTLGNPNIEYEVLVDPDFLGERIDVVDFDNRTAFELKVSPNNPHFEFYKNIFKVIQFNKCHPDKKIDTLLFLNPGHRGAVLERGLGKTAISVAHDYGITVRIHRMIDLPDAA
jgi:hypothetical protein